MLFLVQLASSLTKYGTQYFVHKKTHTINDCEFFGLNSAFILFTESTGGAIHVINGSITVLRSVFLYNVAVIGGDIASISSETKLDHCLLTSSFGCDHVGSIWLLESANALITCTNFTSASCKFLFGAVFIQHQNIATFNGCCFYNNAARERGSAIGISSNTTANITFTNFVNNTLTHDSRAATLYLFGPDTHYPLIVLMSFVYFSDATNNYTIWIDGSVKLVMNQHVCANSDKRFQSNIYGYKFIAPASDILECYSHLFASSLEFTKTRLFSRSRFFTPTKHHHKSQTPTALDKSRTPSILTQFAKSKAFTPSMKFSQVEISIPSNACSKSQQLSLSRKFSEFPHLFSHSNLLTFLSLSASLRSFPNTDFSGISYTFISQLSKTSTTGRWWLIFVILICSAIGVCAAFVAFFVIIYHLKTKKPNDVDIRDYDNIDAMNVKFQMMNPIDDLTESCSNLEKDENSKCKE
jgi:hypothetical protein